MQARMVTSYTTYLICCAKDLVPDLVLVFLARTCPGAIGLWGRCWRGVLQETSKKKTHFLFRCVRNKIENTMCTTRSPPPPPFPPNPKLSLRLETQMNSTFHRKGSRHPLLTHLQLWIRGKGVSENVCLVTFYFISHTPDPNFDHLSQIQLWVLGGRRGY